MATADRQRPQPKARRRPQAAPDEDLDPVVPGPGPASIRQASEAPTAEATALETSEAAGVSTGGHRATAKTELPVAVPRRRRGEPTVQLNVRQPPEVAALVDAVVDATGASKAEVVEAALRAAYQVASD